MSHTIELLGHHLDLVPLIARWHWDEWGGEYENTSLDEWTAQLATKTRTDGMPCSWVAFVDDEPVGSVVLELDGVEPRPELKPDLGGLYVSRNTARGIGSALVRRARRVPATSASRTSTSTPRAPSRCTPASAGRPSS